MKWSQPSSWTLWPGRYFKSLDQWHVKNMEKKYVDKYITHQSTRKRNIHFYGLLRYFKPFYNYHSNIYTNIYISFQRFLNCLSSVLKADMISTAECFFSWWSPWGAAHLGEWGKVRPGSIVWIQNQRRCGFLKRCRCFIYKLICNLTYISYA